MSNIYKEMLEGQKKVCELFGVRVNQILTDRPHGTSMDSIMHWLDSSLDGESKNANVLFLDIDAIPLRKGVIEWILERASMGELCGIAQRANHISNNQHIYVGSPCVALSMDTWRKMGKPSANATHRGDVAEEYTYKAEDVGIPLRFLYPVGFKAPPLRQQWETDTRPYWPLKDDKPEHHYGRGTWYDVFGKGEHDFFHTFQSFMPGSLEIFVEECEKVVKDHELRKDIQSTNSSS